MTGPTYKRFGTGKQQPKFVEHTSYVPAYPKSHVEGYATVVKLPPDANLTKEKIRKFRQSMQYTLTDGRGDALVSHVEFFETEGEDEAEVPMNKSYRRCAGVKVWETISILLTMIDV